MTSWRTSPVSPRTSTGGDLGPGDPEAWTARQVDRFRAGTVEDVVAVWDHEAPTFEDGLRLFGYQVGNHFVGDLFIHLTDVQAALGRPVDRDGTAMWIALDWYLDSLGDSLSDAHVGALAVETGIETRVVGPGDVAAGVTVEPFEMLRACAGRRTTDGDRGLPLVRGRRRLHRADQPVRHADHGRRRLTLRRSARGSTTRRGGPGRP